MDPMKQTILIVGITLAVSIYLIFKFFQWKNQRDQQFPQPKKRAPGTSRPQHASNINRPTPQDTVAGPATPPVVPPAVPQTPEVAASIHGEDLTPVVKPKLEPLPPVLPAASAVASELKDDALNTVDEASRQSAHVWPTEPSVAKQEPTLFDEDVQEDYPYADDGDYVFGSPTPVMASFLPSTDDDRSFMTKVLRNAGYYTPHAWHNLAAIRYLGIMLPVIFFGVMLLLVPERLETIMMLGLIVGPIVGWSLPSLFVRNKASNRLREIGGGVPDMLDLMNMCVSQGMTVPTALGRVSREISPVYPALGKELSIVTEQSRIGSTTQALNNFSRRVDLPEVHSFTSLLTQTEQMGTSVSEALAEHSDNMRESLRQRADEKANSATFKLLFPMVLCLMPAVFLFLLGPAVLEMNRFAEEGGPAAFGPVEIPSRFVEQ